MVNLHSFKSDLIENDNENFKRVLQYEAIYGELPESLEDSAIYKEYLSRFNYEVQYRHPVDESNKFDWKIFLQLVAASDTTEYSLVVNNDGTVDLIIYFEIGTSREPENVNEFSMRVINGLFAVLLSQLLYRFVLIKDSEFWKVILKSSQNERVELFMNKFIPQLRQDLHSYEIMKKFSNKTNK